MQRYTPYVDYENLHDDEDDVTVLPEADGAWVLHSEAQAEIDRLQAEVERLTVEVEELQGAQIVNRNAIRMQRNKATTARDDALEEAAKMVSCMAEAAYDGGLSHHGQAELTMTAIRALKR